MNEFLARATRESLDLFRNFEEWTHGGEASFVETGALFVHGPEDGPKLYEVAGRLNAIGTVTEVFAIAELAARFPQFDRKGLAYGGWEPHAGHADPAGTTSGMLDRAVQLGATVRKNTEVIKIERGPTGLILTTTTGKDIEAGRLLLCAGPWTSQLLAQVDVDLPLWAERHRIATYNWGDAERIPFVWASISDGIYFKPELHAQYLVGTVWEEPRVNPDAFDHELSPDEHLRITMSVVGRIPALDNPEARPGYSALYDVAPDWHRSSAMSTRTSSSSLALQGTVSSGRRGSASTSPTSCSATRSNPI